jgi:hypothetical protein
VAGAGEGGEEAAEEGYGCGGGGVWAGRGAEDGVDEGVRGEAGVEGGRLEEREGARVGRGFGEERAKRGGEALRDGRSGGRLAV